MLLNRNDKKKSSETGYDLKGNFVLQGHYKFINFLWALY